MQPFISVIIPVYNIADFLPLCLQSVVGQSLQNIEIIVINDGSTDQSLEVIRRFESQDKRMIVVNQLNQGIVLARKVGMDMAKGEYIHHLDGDDYLEPNAYQLLYQEAKRRESSILMFPFFIENKQGKARRESKRYPEACFSSVDFLRMVLPTQEYFSVWQYIYKKELLDNDIVFSPHIRYGEDMILTTQLICYSSIVDVIDSPPLLHYIIHPDSITNSGLTSEKSSNLMEYPVIVSGILKGHGLYVDLEREISCLIFSLHLYILSHGELSHLLAICRNLKALLKAYPSFDEMIPSRRIRRLIAVAAVTPWLGQVLGRYYRYKKRL